MKLVVQKDRGSRKEGEVKQLASSTPLLNRKINANRNHIPIDLDLSTSS